MKIGAIGTGTIVETFLEAVAAIKGIECAALYSRRRETGEPLVKKFGIGTLYTDPEDLLNDSRLDFIYVASPNSLHYGYARRALQCGRNVICEKPFTSTLRETENLISLAEEKRLFLFEAITTIHLPNFRLIREHLHEIGQVGFVQSSFCKYSSKYDAFRQGSLPNVFNPEFSGGALMDLNIYNLHFVTRLLGIPDEIRYIPRRHKNGIDLSGVLILRYPDALCECVAGKDFHALNSTQIHGDRGYIHIPGSVSGCHSFTVFADGKAQTHNAQKTTNNLYHELLVFREIFESGDLPRCRELQKHSHDVMRLLCEARRDGGIVFAADKTEAVPS